MFPQKFKQFRGQWNPSLFVILRYEANALFSISGYVKFPLAENDVIPSRARHLLLAASGMDKKQVPEFIFIVHDFEKLDDLVVVVRLGSLLDRLGQAY